MSSIREQSAGSNTGAEAEKNPTIRGAWGGRGADLQLGCFFSALWTAAIMPKAPTNAGYGDLLVLATYLLVYAAFWAGAAGLLRVVFRLILGPWLKRGGPGWLAKALAYALISGVNLILLVPAFKKGMGMGYAQGAAAFVMVFLLAALPWRASAWLGRVATLALPVTFFLFAQPVWERNHRQSEIDLTATERVQTGQRIRLLGLDGMDLGLTRDLIAAGVELPHIQHLLDEGTSGPLETNSPHSPVVWTSIATGRKPSEHGVRTYSTAYFRGAGLSVPHLQVDFISGALDRAFHFKEVGGVSSAERNVKALWEILTDFGVPSLMINWWASFPAEEVDGVIISNHTVPWGTLEAHAVAELSNIDQLVYPPEIKGAVIKRVQNFVEAADLGAVKRDAFSAAGWAYFKARDDIMIELYNEYRGPNQRLSTVYLQGIDTASHAYSTILFGDNRNKKRPMRVPQAEADEWWQSLVVESYQRMDRLLGAQLADLAPDENLVVVSDHGWRYDGTSHWNKPPGIFMAYGPAFQEGYHLKNARVYDVLPTLATLLGLPISDELEGRSLDRAFKSDGNIPTASTIPTYGERRQELRVAQPEAIDDGHIDRLKALGYVD